MKLTTNYGLNKPDYTDQIDIQKINENFEKIDNSLSPYASTSGSNAYTVTISGITSYIDGLKVTVKIGTTSTGASTLNINSLGAKTILDNQGNAITSGGLKAGIPYNLCFNGTNFIVLGKGGGGNLIPKYLLAGYYGEGDNGRVDGAMINRNAPTVNLNAGGKYNLQEGYYSGGQIVANSLASQTPANSTAAQILAGYTAWVNGIKLTGDATIESLGGLPLSAKWTVTKTTAYGTSQEIQVATNFLSQVTNKLLFYLESGQAWCCWSDFYNANNSTNSSSSQFFRKPFDGNNSGVSLNVTSDGTVTVKFNTSQNPRTITIYVLA